MSGGFSPAPFHFGSSRRSVEEAILKALNEGQGSAFSDEDDSYVYAENFAVARALAEIWSANRRLSYQWDSERMTDFLGRWEKILGLHPVPGTSDADRRLAVGLKLSMVGKPATPQVVHDLMVRVLGDIFVAIVNGDSATALGYVPGSVTISGGVSLDDGPWASSIAYVAVHAEKTASTSDLEFYTTAGNVHVYLDSLLPAWVDFGWYRNNSLGALGFILDDQHNLDNEAFA